MPRRLTINDVKDKVEKYGFFIVDGQTYKNNTAKLRVFDAQQNKYVSLSLKQMLYRINKDKRGEFDYMNILPVDNIESQQEPQQQPLTSTQRWINKMNNNPYFNSLSQDEKAKMFTKFGLLMKQFNRNKHITISFKKSDLTSKQRLYILIESLKEYIKKRPNKLIRIETVDEYGFQNNHTLTVDTLSYFMDLLNDEPKQEMTDSVNYMFEDFNDWQTVDIYFEDRKKPAGGFFTYINKMSLDLSVYGIYNNIDKHNYVNNCLIQSFVNSGLFTQDEINLVNNCINTRVIKVEDLKDISNMLNTQIVIRVGNDKDNDTKPITFKPTTIDNNTGGRRPSFERSETRKLTLILYMSHFMLYRPVYVSEYYIKHYEELDMRYKHDNERFYIIDESGTKKKTQMSLIRLIKTAIKYHAFEYIPLDKQYELTTLYKHLHVLHYDEIIDGYFKPIHVKDLNDKQMDYLNKMNNNDGYKLFASHIPREQLDDYYRRLQNIINSLGVNINVRSYVSYSQLMEKLMYEYGCLDNVYKICGPIADNIRSSLTFPSPHTADGKPFYSNKKLYYIDLNGAYLSCIDSIPAGKCDVHGVFTQHNDKIKELLMKLYDIRTQLKPTDPVLADTIKYMSNSCWGLSIKTNKRFIKTKPKDKQEFINQNCDYVVEFNSEFIKYVKSINVHYSYPQFAKHVLDSFHKKINEVVKLVRHVYYYNVDALLIDEDDYNKLNNLGYIGSALGQFKIEHIFKEICIKSKRQYMAVLDDGLVFSHCKQSKHIQSSINGCYQTFKDTVLSSPDTTKLLQV